MGLPNTIRFRVFAAVFVSILSIVVIILFLMYQNLRQQILSDAEKRVATFSGLFQNQVEKAGSDLALSIQSLLNDPTLARHMAEDDRKGLEGRLLPLYKEVLKPKGIAQFQFHLPPATSFLRLHKPGKFGDDLSGFRKTVLQVNKEAKPVVGIEVGRGGPGLRVVYPVFHDGGHIGSVEFGGSIDGILKSIAESLGMEYGVGIKKKVFENARRFDTKPTDVIRNDVVFYTYSGEGVKELIGDNGVVSGVLLAKEGGKTSLYATFPVTDFSGETIGYIALGQDVTPMIHTVESRFWSLFAVVLLLSLAVSVGIYLLIRKVLSPLEEFQTTLDELASHGGDLTIRLPEGGNEIGKASAGINRFIGSIAQIVSEVKSSAEKTHATGDQLSDEADNLSKAAVEQRELIEGSQQLTKEIATELDISEEMAITTSEDVQNDMEVLEAMVSSLKKVVSEILDASNAGHEMAESIHTLSGRASEVKDILGIIRDIADQTNLLALNAAIEAARAGEHGRGFAVVAEEVRKLAERTQKSLGEIDATISTMVQEVDHASQGMNSSAEEIVRISEEAGGLIELAEETRSKTIRTVEVSVTASKKAVFIAQKVKTLMSMMAKTTERSQENEAVARELNQIAHTLRDATNAMDGVIGRFKSE